MYNTHFTKQELYSLRNHIPVDKVIEKLKIPFKISEGYFKFCCPICKEFNTAVNPKTNLARCFLCKKNYNTIDMVMKVRRLSFVDSVKFLQKFNIPIEHSSTPMPVDNSNKKVQNHPVAIGNILENMNLPILTKPSQNNLNVSMLIKRIIKLEDTVQTLSKKIIAIEQQK